MWTVVYMACDKQTAKKVEGTLKDEGILVRSREIVVTSRGNRCCIEILVPESEALEAQQVIYENNL